MLAVFDEGNYSPEPTWTGLVSIYTLSHDRSERLIPRGNTTATPPAYLCIFFGGQRSLSIYLPPYSCSRLYGVNYNPE
jgi:hypothetical protein